MNKALIIIILASVYGCGNEKITRNGKIYELKPKCVSGHYQHIYNGKFSQLIWICTKKKIDTVFVENCPDWQSDSTVSMERRNVYKYWQSVKI